MTGDLFIFILEHIKHHTKCTKEEKILLFLYNHDAYITVEAIMFCRENGIVMVTSLLHVSHKLQPLCVSVYRPFKNYCCTDFNDWWTSNLGKTITIRKIAVLRKLSFQEAFNRKSSSERVFGFKFIKLYYISFFSSIDPTADLDLASTSKLTPEAVRPYPTPIIQEKKRCGNRKEKSDY